MKICTGNLPDIVPLDVADPEAAKTGGGRQGDNSSIELPVFAYDLDLHAFVVVAYSDPLSQQLLRDMGSLHGKPDGQKQEEEENQPHGATRYGCSNKMRRDRLVFSPEIPV